MKPTKLDYLYICLVVFIIVLGGFLSGCSSGSGSGHWEGSKWATEKTWKEIHKAEKQHLGCNTEFKVMKAKVLEGNGQFVTYAKLDSFQQQVFKPKDTVWLNMETHLIDDTCTTAMGVVLLD